MTPAASPSPTTISACARSSCAASGARSGPAGMTRPLPMPRLRIDDEDGKILGQRRILESVVHDDDAGAGRHRRLRALHAVARDDGGRGARQQQRLVADIGCAMLHRIDPHRTGKPPAIAAAQERRRFAGGLAACARPQAPPASCRRRRRSDCRCRRPARRLSSLFAPYGARRRRRRSPPTATAAQRRGRPAATRTAAHAWLLPALQPDLHEIGIERGHRPLERAAEPLDGLARRTGDRAPAPWCRSARRRHAPSAGRRRRSVRRRARLSSAS